MPRSVRLVAALAWLLQLGACGDQPPAKAPRHTRVAPPAVEASQVRVHRRRPLPDGSSGPLEPAESQAEVRRADAQAAAWLTTEQLAQRYARARVLSVHHGSASYYGDSFAGRRTASGAPYEPRAFTAAHRSLPFGSVLRVTRTDGGQSVYVRVTDRGPYGPRGRILDLSRAAAERLGMLRAGVVKIKLEIVEYGAPRKPRRRRH
jgi:rare lipoprotein A